ncbi:tannase/feruloyl esterase family alpha/beta hydrolase [Acidovorax sp. ACV02]|uniref:tannase/feruloyl esterase family alpha/beta hydrolase n=1 Tax=Acidovorax sp. ACV02 TaxID=2769310 RepID=UPI00177B4B18|nr:tannase/feruloyl esterase family alpha/beta hydrolase [Acidovorax sp. ACV02]MBD9408399.1 tannase/feruloyl esterase family alpha/beta hydrolase [Acidovorax sp. ACV02]
MKTNQNSWKARAGIAGLAAVALGGCGSGGGGDILPPVGDNISIQPTRACTMQGIGSALLTADAPVSILEVTTGTTGTATSDKPYCLVKVKVDPQVNIWVSLPTTSWNGRFRAEGNGVYAGSSQLAPAVDSVRQGFAGATTDTGHTGFFLSGAFGMESPGKPNTQLQNDFAHRSEHLMAVVGKQLVKAFYAQDPVRSYWYGCSTGGRQGLMMAQRYPADYDAILAGAPAIHWDRFQAYQIWPQVVMQADAAGPLSTAKRELATQRAVAACDAADGVADGVIRDPRSCTYDPTKDSQITRADCSSADGTCLAPGEATALQKIWGGARNTAGQLLWPGVERGADLNALAGAEPFPIPIEQARYWVYFDPTWDWRTLNLANYEAFFSKNAEMVGPVMATDNPDISAFKQRGGKLIMYHGWNDNLIMPQGTVRYYERVQQTVGASEDFSRLYMVPGMNHCSGGSGPSEFGQRASGAVPMEAKTDIFRALMAWSEKGAAPADITASKIVNGAVAQTRPLCPHPQVAKYKGAGSTDDAANFTCSAP